MMFGIIISAVILFGQWNTCHCSVYNSEDATKEHALTENDTMKTVYKLLQKARSDILCKKWDLKIKDEDVLLNIGFCMTYEEGEGISLSECPYFLLKGHNMTEPGYIKLPNNISQLNGYMCGPMNRKGLLCKDCIDGFGPSATSFGYECSNCTDAWYNVPLYLLLELVPVTVFYLIILVFPIPITSAPMTCFIMYNQFIMFEMVVDQQPPIGNLVITQLENNQFFLKIVTFISGIWNLDLLSYIVPQICISKNFHLIHIALLGYTSLFYQVLLISVTWICIELHGHNFKPILWLWRPFKHYFARLQRRWDSRSDIIDVFSAFFLISYSKVIYLSAIFLECSCVTKLNEEGNVSYRRTLYYDRGVDCVGVGDSTKSFSISILATISIILICILVVLLLVLYPIKIFRACLSKCRLDRLAVTTFVEKFHCCYKDGLDGGRDMRSFSGFYFILRTLPYTYYGFGMYKLNWSISVWSYTGFIFLAAALLIALVRPYKHNYMNILDALLLAHFTIVCHLLSLASGSNYGENVQLFIVILIPAIVFGLILIYKVSLKFIKKKIIRCCNCCCRKLKDHMYFKRNDVTTEQKRSEDNSGNTPLLQPTVSVITIGSYGSFDEYN